MLDLQKIAAPTTVLQSALITKPAFGTLEKMNSNAQKLSLLINPFMLQNVQSPIYLIVMKTNGNAITLASPLIAHVMAIVWAKTHLNVMTAVFLQVSHVMEFVTAITSAVMENVQTQILSMFGFVMINASTKKYPVTTFVLKISW
jgi:hypothetical protein